MNENDRLELVAGHRRCTKCGIAKPLSQFHKQSRGKLHPRCKVCRNEGFIADRARAAAGTPRQLRREDAIFLAKTGKRRCKVCGEALDYSQFMKLSQRVRADGTTARDMSTTCLSCEKRDVASILRDRELRELAKEGKRRCKKCEQVLPLDKFYKRSGGSGYQSQCIPCYNGHGGEA